VSLLDFIFPKRCVNCGAYGAYLCKKCVLRVEFVEHPVCPVCQRQAIGGKVHPICRTKYSLDGLVAAAKYRGPVKPLISKLKYKYVSDIGEVLVNLIAQNFWRYEAGQKLKLVPIPLHKRRKNWRGFNQAEVIASIISAKFGVGVSNILVRVIETKTQVGLKAEDRKKNVKDAFGLAGSVDRDVVYILVDDVFTTGATMNEACRVMKRAGAREVWAMVVALG
jgi:ComF family protein